MDTLNAGHSAPHFSPARAHRPVPPSGQAGSGAEVQPPHTRTRTRRFKSRWRPARRWTAIRPNSGCRPRPCSTPTVAVMAWCFKTSASRCKSPPLAGRRLRPQGTIWAANNKRRKQAAAGLWPLNKGWWMHVEVPHQKTQWHHDCGQLRRTEMFRLAQELLDKQ